MPVLQRLTMSAWIPSMVIRRAPCTPSARDCDSRGGGLRRRSREPRRWRCSRGYHAAPAARRPEPGPETASEPRQDEPLAGTAEPGWPDKAMAFFVAGQNLNLRDDDPDYPALV